MWGAVGSNPDAAPALADPYRLRTEPGGCSLGVLRRGGAPGVAEGGDHLLREAVEVVEPDVERRAEWSYANDAVEAGIALLDRLQRLDDVLRPAGEEAAGIHGILGRRRF